MNRRHFAGKRTFGAMVLVSCTLLLLQQILDRPSSSPGEDISRPTVLSPMDPASMPTHAEVVSRVSLGAIQVDKRERSEVHLQVAGRPYWGKVVDRMGQPMTSASVSLEYPHTPPSLVAPATVIGSVTTDASGRYEFDVASGPHCVYAVRVTMPGYACARETAKKGVEQVVMIARESAIDGAVFLESGEIAREATVRVRDLSGGSEVLVGASADGRFTAEGLQAGVYKVTAYSNFARSRSEDRVQVLEGSRASVVFRLPADGAAIVGTVVDAETGLPVEGAWISQSPIFAGAKSRSAADGSFRIAALTPGTQLNVFARASGYASWQTACQVTDANAGLEIRLDKGMRVSGRVIAMDGSALPGASLHLVGEYEKGPIESRFTAYESLRQVSGSDGGFEFRSVRSGLPYRLLLTAPGRTSVTVMLTENLESDIVKDVVLDWGVMGQGVVVDGMGAPIAGARVELRESADAEPVAIVKTSSDGAFAAWGLRLGVSFSCSATDEAGRLGSATLKPGEIAEIVMTDGERLQGTVVREDGMPFDECAVSVVEEKSGRVTSKRFSGDRFTLRGLGSGPYRVSAWTVLPGRETRFGVQEIVRDSGADLVLVVPRLAQLKGQVRSYKTNAPLGGVSIEVKDSVTGESLARLLSATDGTFAALLPAATLCDMSASLGASVTEGKRLAVTVAHTMLLDEVGLVK